MTRQTFAQQLARLRKLAGESRYGRRDVRGTLAEITDGQRSRAAEAVVIGRSVSLARELDTSDHSWELSVHLTPPSDRSPMRIATDRFTVECHGRTLTHLDGLNHVGYDETWYSGWPLDAVRHVGIDHWAGTGIFTRAVHVDLTEHRGTAWAEATAPVTGDEIEAKLAADGVMFHQGDALLLDMGRDRWEAAGHSLESQWTASREHEQPGLSVSAADWIADSRPSLVCWDFQDVVHPTERRFSTHPLIWAVGQVFIDNCAFGRLRSMPDRPRIGALSVAPISIRGATGCLVNPLFLY